MNNYDDEATKYQNADDEATQFEDSTSKEVKDEDTSCDNGQEEVKADKKGGWKRYASGVASGILIGGISTVLMGMKKPDETNTNTPGKSQGSHKEELSNPEWVDDQVAVASSVDDDMTFSEAFAAARAEVGPGGCFEWHGQIYGTYTAEEWSNMTAEERAEYGDHFSWNHIDRTQSQVAQHSPAARQSASETSDHPETDDDDIDIISVDHNGDNHTSQNQEQNHQQNQNQAQNHQQNQNRDNSHEKIDGGGDDDVRIIGVSHDEGNDVNIAHMTLNNEEVILVDVDNDMVFDYLAVDRNHNNQLDNDEIYDIQDQNITVNDLGGFSNPSDNLYADNNGPEPMSYNGYES